jgi:hypothetical protein
MTPGGTLMVVGGEEVAADSGECLETRDPASGLKLIWERDRSRAVTLARQASLATRQPGRHGRRYLR